MADQDYPELYQEMKDSAQAMSDAAVAHEQMLAGDINTDVNIPDYGLRPSFAKQIKSRVGEMTTLYLTSALAQAAITAGLIPEGYVVKAISGSDQNSVLFYQNVGGVLTPILDANGAQVSEPTAEAYTVLESQLAALTSSVNEFTEAYPEFAEITVDNEGKATTRRFADGTSQFPALMIGEGLEFVQMVGGGFVCQIRDSGEEVFKITPSGVFIQGNTLSWVTDDPTLAGYTTVRMDGEGRIYRRTRVDGTVEQIGDGGSGGDTSDSYPAVASVDGNIIAVSNDVVTYLTSDEVSIAPVAYQQFARWISNFSTGFKAHRGSYDGLRRLRESKRTLLHLIVTGQSLSVGGSTQSQGLVTTSAQADYGIVSFSCGPKVDFNYDTLNVDLLKSTLPCRENIGTRPGQESPSSGIGFQIHDITGNTVLVSTAGASGQAIANISTGTATFAGATAMIQAGAALAEELGMVYQPVLVLIHGNQNAAGGTSQASYRAAMENLRAQYEAVVNAATGGTDSLHMFVGQLSNIIPYGGTAGTTKTNTIGVAQYMEARDNELVHLASAQYARPYSDGEHLTSAGYRTEGEVIGALIARWVNDSSVSALMPVESSVVQSGNTITIPVTGCVGALTIDTTRVADPGNYGFAIVGATISSVAVAGSGSTARVIITKTDSSTATRVSYAETGVAGQNPGPLTGSRGCIRDSQQGASLAGLPLYNDLCVFAFTLA